MIKIVAITEEDRRRLNQTARQNYNSIFWTICVFFIISGFVFGVWDVTLFCILLGVLIFHVIVPLLAGGLDVVRQADVKIIRKGILKEVLRKADRSLNMSVTTMEIVLQEHPIPENYYQGNTFAVHSSFGGHLILKDSDQDFYQFVDKEIELEYIARNGFVIAIRTQPPFVLGNLE